MWASETKGMIIMRPCAHASMVFDMTLSMCYLKGTLMKVSILILPHADFDHAVKYLLKSPIVLEVSRG